ncbi:MAG: 4-alpha-glucanotransferase [Chloroflexota bacterium]|jgi:4-alpha-glucanotransferase
MYFNRASGIILHPTSLPGPDGIGDLGPEAYRWINFLSDAGCKLWQVLPLGPTGYGDSPYQCFSAFAGNPYLVSPVLLLEDGLLKRSDLADRPDFIPNHIDYGEAIQWKLTILDRAYEHFKFKNNSTLWTAYHEFVEKESAWLDDFALFMAIKEAHGGVSWEHWSPALRKRDHETILKFRRLESDRIQRHAFRQFLFFRQWLDLKTHANSKNIQIIGDIPIFVAYDSADAWANPDLFYLDDNSQPIVVAGVPPDYFSPTGQLWGNPLYKWDIHRQQNFVWWIKRMQATLRLVDIVRLDHFRGFCGYWEVPYGMPTAEVGRWVKGPGADLFQAIRDALGDLPIIAEDLGVITPDVVELRDHFQLPGMKVFQFAFTSDPLDPFLPHNYEANCVAYTGTHDNDTALGWYQTAPDNEKDFIRRYVARSGDDISWDMVRAVWSSVAVFALAPMQDILSLGNEARMNLPGRASGNWTWRLHPDALSASVLKRLKEVNFLYARSTIEKVAKDDIPTDYIPLT